ncbi:MAG: hypothetical protein ACHQ2F_10095 [Desulfobaccales bacterium]
MSDESEKQARSIANSSGFPLQIRVANIAESSSRWKVLLKEHPWRSDETGSEGFLDLVLFKPGLHKRDVMVIECKRVKQSQWVFLIPDPQPSRQYNTCVWETKYTYENWKNFDWVDRMVEPDSYESQFCAIPGQEQGRRNLLERTAVELIQATEALAGQEKELHQEKIFDQQLERDEPVDFPVLEFHRLYIPVIVTTAKLIISNFEPGSISLEDGCLPSDSAFEEVPVVRFRKSLTTKVSSSLGRDIGEVHEKTQRTVFVVNAEGFQSFLAKWGLIDSY